MGTSTNETILILHRFVASRRVLSPRNLIRRHITTHRLWSSQRRHLTQSRASSARSSVFHSAQLPWFQMALAVSCRSPIAASCRMDRSGPMIPAIDGSFYGPLPQSYEPSPQAQPYNRKPPHPTKCSQYAYSTCLHDAGTYCRKDAASEPAATRAVEHTACLARYQSTCREVHCD